MDHPGLEKKGRRSLPPFHLSPRDKSAIVQQSTSISQTVAHTREKKGLVILEFFGEPRCV